MIFLNPITPYDVEGPALKNLTDNQRFLLALINGVIYFIVFCSAVLICGLFFTSCSTPRAVEEHHHHHYEVDTLAVQQQVDRQLTSWHEDMTKLFFQKLQQYTDSWSSHEDQKETISELNTETTDSLGRKVRQEQRTISRDITRELQQQEQRITQEMQAQLRVVVDSVNDVWQQRYDSLASHVEQLDSAYISHQPSAIDHRPWYQRWWEHVKWLVVGAVLAAVLWFTRRR